MKKSLRSSLKTDYLRLTLEKRRLISASKRAVTTPRQMRGCVRCKISILYKTKPAPGPLSHPALALRLR